MIKNNFLPSFFEFKNKETEKAIISIVSQNEGVEIDKVNKYLSLAHAKKKAKLLVEIQNKLKEMLRSYPHLTLSDFKGLVDMGLTHIHLDRIKLGEKYVDIHLNPLRKR